jgi:integrase
MKLDQRGKSFSFRKHVRDENGAWALRRFTLESTTLREAKREMHEVLAKVERENYVDPGGMTVSDVCARWLVSGRSSGTWVAKTYIRYAGIVRDHINPVLGNERLRALGALKVSDALNKWRGRASANPRRPGKLSTRSVHAVYAALRSAMRFAVNQQLIPLNPCTLRVSSKANEKVKKGLAVEELVQLIRFMGVKWFFCHVIVLVTTGIRRGELFGLRWRNINFVASQLSIEGVVAQNEDKRYAYRPFPKTHDSRRTIQLPETAVLVLTHWREMQRSLHAEVGMQVVPDGFVFPGDCEGGVSDPDQLSSAFSWFIRSTNVPKTSLHNLRHSNARAHISAGNAIEVIKEVLGHSDHSTTSNLYVGIDTSVHRQAARRLDLHIAPISEIVQRQVGASKSVLD